MLGDTEVGAIGLGAMPLSLEGAPDEATGVRVIHAALDAGMSLIDTADVYCIDDRDLGANERLVARALREWRGARPQVATKGGCERPGGAWTLNGRPQHLRAACERSLRALGVDCIDVYQLHALDSQVPLADSVGALADLRRAGKVRQVGLSNVNGREIGLARAIVPIVSVQNRLSPFDTASFADGTLAYCHRENIILLAHSPVGGHRGHARCASDPTLNAVAARHQATPYQVCLAWLLTLTPAMLPIPGASKVASAESSAAAAALTLTDADQAELARAFPAVTTPR